MQKPIDNQAVYHTWILVVLWVFQLLVELVVVGVNVFYLTAGSGYSSSGFIAGVFISLAFGAGFVISHIVQIVFYGRCRLTPRANFAYDCTRFVIWTIVLIFNIIGAGYIVSLISAIVIWILYLLGIIYASILFHRQRRGQYDNLLPRSHNQRIQQGKQEVDYQNAHQNGSYSPANQQPYQQQFRQSQPGRQQPY